MSSDLIENYNLLFQLESGLTHGKGIRKSGKCYMIKER